MTSDPRSKASIDGGRAIDWSRTSADYATHRPGPPPRLFEVLAALGIGVPGQRLLDLGTGTGLVAREFARRGAIVSGIDVAPGQASAQRRAHPITEIQWPRLLLVLANLAQPAIPWTLPAKPPFLFRRSQRVPVHWAGRHRPAQHRAYMRLRRSHGVAHRGRILIAVQLGVVEADCITALIGLSARGRIWIH